MTQEVQGSIKRFRGNGRKLGYPTANLMINTEAQDGVYFGYADLDSYVDHPALIFVGVPTTVGDISRRVEVHLLDIPDIDYYDQELKARLSHYHRANHTFDSIDELLVVMADDEHRAREWFKTARIA